MRGRGRIAWVGVAVRLSLKLAPGVRRAHICDSLCAPTSYLLDDIEYIHTRSPHRPRTTPAPAARRTLSHHTLCDNKQGPRVTTIPRGRVYTIRNQSINTVNRLPVFRETVYYGTVLGSPLAQSAMCVCVCYGSTGRDTRRGRTRNVRVTGQRGVYVRSSHG